MRIGIDIDGVLNAQYEFSIDYGTKFCHEIGKYELKNTKALDTTEMFCWGEEVAHQFWNQYRKDLTVTLPAKKHAAEVIKKLRENKHEIWIITARKNNDEWFPKSLRGDVEELTKKWLAENDILYDKIVFDVKDKGIFCKENAVHVMIDDDPMQIRKLVGKTKVIIYDYPYNQKREFAHLLRGYSWYDIYDKLLKMEEEKK